MRSGALHPTSFFARSWNFEVKSGPKLTIIQNVQWFDIVKNKKFKNLALSNIPMGKAAKESDVATAVCFLASDAAAMITGSSILIDGGWTAK